MRHLVLVVSLVVLVAPAADARVAEWVGDDVTIQEPAARERLLERARRDRQRPQPPVEVPPPIVEIPAAPPRAPTATPVIAADGAVETLMPDGSTRRARPGDCGWTIVHPDGRKNTVACANVQRANLPVTGDETAAWLVAHADALLGIARRLLGDNAASIENYLKTVESEQPGIYERIWLRMELIAKLTGQL